MYRSVWSSDNLPGRGTAIGYGTFAVTNLNYVTGGRVEEAVHVFDLPSRRFVSGTNVLALEVHQSTVANAAQVDLSFDLSLSSFDFRPGGLRIDRENSTNVVRWPDHLADWFLEETSDFSNWSAVAGPFDTSDGFIRYLINPNARGFYRLRQAER